MNFLTRIVLRWAGLVALVGTALGVVGGYYSVQLYKNLRTDMEELLPSTARSVLDLNEVSQRLVAIDNLAILIFSQHPEESKEFVIALAQRLNEIPKDVASSVEYKIDKEIQFFKERRALYMDLSDLIRIRSYIADRIHYEKELYNPLTIFQGEEIPEPRLDFHAIQNKYARKTSAYDRFPGGYYATPDGTKRVILVYMPGKSSGIDAMKRLRHAVNQAILDVNPKKYASDIEIKFTGDVENKFEEHEALIADLELSTIIVAVVVSFAMLLFYKSFWPTVALVVSLFMGTLWTFGVSYFAVGYLNANSAFLGSIVIGNGINFGIVFLARYLEERRKDRNNTWSVHTAVTSTAKSTWTAALAAGLSYGSLMLTGFRGFKQFGVIGLIGMILCWISAFTLLPAYLTVLDYLGLSQKRMTSGKKHRPTFMGLIARLIDRYPAVIWSVSFGMTILSLAMFTRFNPETIVETNLSNLRNKESMERGSGYLSKYVDEIFQRYLSPLVIFPKDREDAREIAALLRDKQKQEGKKSLIANVQTLDDFIPNDQSEKVRVLKDIKGLLPPKILKRLSPAEQKLVHEFLVPTAFKPIREKDLPALIVSKFTEKDGSIGKMVLVEPPITNETHNGRNLIHFVHSLRESADAIAPGTPVAGGLPITSDMVEAVHRDGPRATAFAFFAVLVLVVFLFRNPRTVMLILVSLCLGVVWLVGIMLGLGIKVNFLNFIALPITFGIGVDYGVNIFQRYREESRARRANDPKYVGILPVIRNTGGAVALCSLTTIIGYSSLLLAGNQAFVSFGTLAVTGELTCVIAAVISLPSYILLKDRLKK